MTCSPSSLSYQIKNHLQQLAKVKIDISGEDNHHASMMKEVALVTKAGDVFGWNLIKNICVSGKTPVKTPD